MLICNPHEHSIRICNPLKVRYYRIENPYTILPRITNPGELAIDIVLEEGELMAAVGPLRGPTMCVCGTAGYATFHQRQA